MPARRLPLVIAPLAIALLLPSAALAGVVWDESIDGDLSNFAAGPTPVGTLSLGSNTLIATSGGSDIEYFSITIPDGAIWSELVLVSYDSLDDIGFIAIEPGPVFTPPPGGTDVSVFLGYDHFGPAFNDVGKNILKRPGNGNGAIGFDKTLPAGTYSLWVQNQGGTMDYTFDFVLTPAPAPAGVFALLAMPAWGARRRPDRLARSASEGFFTHLAPVTADRTTSPTPRS
ncbi:MAG: hypothetical protein R3B49_08515 [Phycisphaerales bacterium]